MLMTAYNREAYIAEAIESVLSSTYQNIELIVVDNQSSDRTVEIVQSFVEKDSRLKLFINEKNIGDYPNRNRAASHATGKYLKYVDSDDYIYPYGLEIMVDMMESFPDAGWGLCSLFPNNDHPYPVYLPADRIFDYNYFVSGIFHKAPLSCIIKTEVFRAVHGFSETRMSSDFEMWNRLALTYPVVLMPDGIVWSRLHPHQEGKRLGEYVLDYERIRFSYLDNPACGLSKAKSALAKKNYKKQIGKYLLMNLLKMDFRQARLNFTVLRFIFNK